MTDRRIEKTGPLGISLWTWRAHISNLKTPKLYAADRNVPVLGISRKRSGSCD